MDRTHPYCYSPVTTSRRRRVHPKQSAGINQHSSELGGDEARSASGISVEVGEANQIRIVATELHPNTPLHPPPGSW